jgi:hypothetical protein
MGAVYCAKMGKRMSIVLHCHPRSVQNIDKNLLVMMVDDCHIFHIQTSCGYISTAM